MPVLELVKHLGDITSEDFDYVYDLNVRGTLLLMTQAVLPSLAERSRIINIASVGARAGFPGLSVYCSSKAAIEGLTRSWAAELGHNGTTVNTVNPGPVQSEMLNNIPKEIVEAQNKATPLQNRVGTVEEVAEVVGWLAWETRVGGSTGQAISAQRRMGHVLTIDIQPDNGYKWKYVDDKAISYSSVWGNSSTAYNTLPLKFPPFSRYSQLRCLIKPGNGLKEGLFPW